MLYSDSALLKKLTYCATVVSISLLAVFLLPNAGASAESEPVNVHIPSFDISVIPLYVARGKGYFREEGLEPSMILARPNLGINGMLSGNFHFSASAGSASTAIARNIPLKVVLVNSFKPTFWIYGRENIKSPLQLKGKKLAVSSLGGLSHTLARLALKKSGLDPDRDVVMIAAGTGETRPCCLEERRGGWSGSECPGKI
jgi:NitT/TauT family transport system substrate-binding protein